MKRAIHITVNKKSGVGQTIIASSLMQYFDREKIKAQGIDLDTTFSTLSSYRSLDVELIDVSSSGDCSSLSGNKLNSLVERIIVDNKNYVIDANSFSYNGLVKYFCNDTIVNKLANEDIDIYFHIIIRGGAQQMTESLQDLTELLNNTKNIKIYSWLNAYTGDVILANKKFENTNVYLKYSKNFVGSFSIDKLPAYSEPDVKQMLEEHMTITDIECSDLPEPQKAKMKRFTESLITRISHNIL